MDINNSDNILSKLCGLNESDYNDINFSFSLVSKQKESDSFYQSTELALAPEVIKWMKKHIISELKELRTPDESGALIFNFADYNHEIAKLDKIARHDLSTSEAALLKDKKDKLTTSLSMPNPQYDEKETDFQMAKLHYDGESVYFCFYKGVKKTSSRKKKMIAKNSKEFNFVSETIIELGGKISFIIVNDFIFITNVTNFEYTFDYKDHITKLRDENLAGIMTMPFFESEEVDKEHFEASCKMHLYSRSLAQIKPETLRVLQEKFDERCAELAKIKKRAPKDPEKKKRYIEKFGTVWKLLEYIDVENHKIKFSEGDTPTPLIHFFTDKIAKSFLAEDYRIVTAYD